MTFIATHADEQVTSPPWPTRANEFDGLPYPGYLSGRSKEFISTTDGNPIDNASLENFSQESQVEPSTFLNSSNNFFPSSYVCTCYPAHAANAANSISQDFGESGVLNSHQNECYYTPSVPSFENINVSSYYKYGDHNESDILPIESHSTTQQIYQKRLSLSSAGNERTTSQLICPPTSGPENEPISEETRRKRAHNIIEKRYRDNIDCKFLQLKDVLSSCHRSQKSIDITPHKNSKRLNRAAILEQAHDEILNLRVEVISIKEKLKSIREATFPDTSKYTLCEN
jgi:hypothetical protein